eukprot:1159441-Pelagomonas_calceolata.AAC.13
MRARRMPGLMADHPEPLKFGYPELALLVAFTLSCPRKQVQLCNPLVSAYPKSNLLEQKGKEKATCHIGSDQWADKNLPKSIEEKGKREKLAQKNREPPLPQQPQPKSKNIPNMPPSCTVRIHHHLIDGGAPPTLIRSAEEEDDNE